MTKGQSLQDPFLNKLRCEKQMVAVYLVNGIKLLGEIDCFDQFTIVLKNPTNQLVYKHAISTIVPVTTGTQTKVGSSTQDKTMHYRP